MSRHQYGKPDGDVERLAKWAQTYIRELEAEKGRLEAKLAERDRYITGQHEGTNVFLGRGIQDERPLPKDSHVTFRFSDKWDDAIDVNHCHEAPGLLEVHCLRGSIAVYPRSGNSFRMGPAPR